MYGEGPTKVVAGSFHDTATSLYTAQDIRFTTKSGDLYAIALGWPTDGKLTIHSAGSDSGVHVAGVTLLGSTTTIHWKQDGEGLHLELPSERTGMYAYAFRISPAK